MKKYIFLLFVLSLFVIAGCSTQVVEEGTIEIGSILILSGEGAAWGNAAKNGIDLAIKEINDNGGIDGKELVVYHQDDQSDAQKSISAFRQLVDVKEVDIIIGTTWSHTAIPLIEMASSQEILMISPSLGKAEFNEASPYLFNTWPHDFILSENLGDYIYAKGHRKVAVIGTEQVWVKEQTNAFKKRFEELGGSIEVLLEPLPDTRDLGADALKIKDNSEIDAIVSTTDGILVGALLAKKVRELGVDLPLYSITIGTEDIAAAQGAYEGMEFLTFLTYTNEFEQEYALNYGLDNLDIGGPSAYDAVMLIAQAMKETGSTEPAILQEYLNGVESYDGASGTLISDGEGGFTKDFVVKKVVDGIAVDLD